MASAWYLCTGVLTRVAAVEMQRLGLQTTHNRQLLIGLAFTRLQNNINFLSPRPAHPRDLFYLDLAAMKAAEMVVYIFEHGLISAAVVVGLYAALLGLLRTPAFQYHAVYLHAIQMTWFKDLDVPESIGLLINQVTPFSIRTHEGE